MGKAKSFKKVFKSISRGVFRVVSESNDGSVKVSSIHVGQRSINSDGNESSSRGTYSENDKEEESTSEQIDSDKIS